MKTRPTEKLSPEMAMLEYVKLGVIEIDADGAVWRVGKLDPALRRWKGVSTVTRIARKRAEHKVRGYLRVHVQQFGKRLSVSAHRLVWVNLHGDIPGDLTINHINGIKNDNRPVNLELASLSDQQRHAYYVLGVGGGHCVGLGEENRNAKLTKDQVYEIRRRKLAGETEFSLAKEFGCSRSLIGQVARCEARKHG